MSGQNDKTAAERVVEDIERFEKAANAAIEAAKAAEANKGR